MAITTLVCLAGAATPATVRAGAGLGAPQVLPGSAALLPMATRALATAPPTSAVTAVVYLKPRSAGMLRRVAMASSGRRPLSWSRIQALFMPAATTVARVRSYLAAEGLVVTGGSGLSVRVRGTAAAAGRAFGTPLKVYRDARGRTFRAPAGALRMPSSIAAVVQAVGGLQTNLRLHPMTSGVPQASNPTACATASAAAHTYGGVLPFNLQGYYSFTQLQQSDPGTGERIGLVEFSAFDSVDITGYRSCISGITSAFPTTVAVDGGNTSLGGGRLEAALDVQVAESTAPDAAIDVFEAPNNLGFAPDVIEHMAKYGVTVASDSWGLCEPLIPPSLLEAENNALQVAAVSGMSFFAASGDDGASDCRAATGSLALAVDDPASQPFATGVGGTTLSDSLDASWKDSGGGVSAIWTQPAYQSLVAQPVSASHCTSSTSAPCREVPDISMDANPASGYLTYCKGCFGSATNWLPVGGTSGAAPLAAGITAMANEYSLANGGQRMGFANPFLYSVRSDGYAITDIWNGPSNDVGGGGYPVEHGYDMVTGIGELYARDLQQQLAAYSGGTVSTTPTTITVTSAPASGTIVRYPHSVTISGHLQDGSANPIAGVAVHLWSNYISYRAMTDASGNWSISFIPRQSANWHPVYTGSDTDQGSTAPSVYLRVRPLLTAAARLPFSSGRYHATTGRTFTVTAVTRPNMHGAVLTLEYHVWGSTRWHIVKTAGVGPQAVAHATSMMPNPHSARYYRWFYTGRVGYRWVSSISPTILITTP